MTRIEARPISIPKLQAQPLTTTASGTLQRSASVARAWQTQAGGIPNRFWFDMLGKMSTQDKVREVLIGEVDSSQPYTGSGIYFGDHMKALKNGEQPSFAQASKQFGAYTTSELNSADQEGGAIDRFKQAGYAPMPAAEDIAKMSPAEIRQLARDQADHARALNVRMIYAPVLDHQSTDKGDPALFSNWDGKKNLDAYDPRKENSRRYGADSATIERTATLYLEAFKGRTREIQDEIRQQTGDPKAKFDVLVVAKHFPGESHPVDSDDAQIHETRSEADLRASADVFAHLKQKGLIDAVMISNNVYDALGEGAGITNKKLVGWATDMGLPTTTDDTALPRRIKAGDDIGKLAVDAFDAGNTFIMVCDGGKIRQQVENALVQHVEDHPELKPLLDRRVAQILQMKNQAGLISR